jgi:hypothetical protein
MVTRVVLKVGFGLPVTQESRAVMTSVVYAPPRNIIAQLRPYVTKVVWCRMVSYGDVRSI